MKGEQRRKENGSVHEITVIMLVEPFLTTLHTRTNSRESETIHSDDAHRQVIHVKAGLLIFPHRRASVCECRRPYMLCEKEVGMRVIL